MLVGHFNDNFRHLGPVYMEESNPAKRVTRPGGTNKRSVYMESSYTRKNAQGFTDLKTSFYKSVHKLSASCVRTACTQLL
jgi:hypothetical protein